MIGVRKEANLYLMDFGNFIKIGHTTSLRDRVYSFAREVEDEMDFSSSIYWPMARTVAMGLENALLHKYKDFRLGHEAAKKEILSSSVKEEVVKDINDFVENFHLDTEETRLTEQLIGWYEEGSLIVRYTKMLKAIPVNVEV